MALTFQNLYTLYLEHTGDPSAANTTIGKARINDTHKELVALHDWYFAEKTDPFTTQANDYTYDLPYDFGRMVGVTVKDSDVHYSLTEVASHDEWQRIQMYRETSTSDIPELFHVTGDRIEIYPVPSSNGAANNGIFYYTKRVVDMQYDNHTTGTITLTNGDETVEGASSPAWINSMIGRFLRGNLDARWYEIASITDTDTLELKKKFQGTTASTLAYTIGEMPLIPEDYHALLWYQPVATYWMMKKEPEQAAYYQALYDKGKREFFNSYSKRTSGQIMKAPYMRHFGTPRTFDGSWIDDDY